MRYTGSYGEAGLEQHILVGKDWDHDQCEGTYPWRKADSEKPIGRFSNLACLSDHTALDEKQEDIARLTPEEVQRDQIWDYNFLY
ncbi:hypothetical protein PG993_009874 [Apiospora rasikravindrae]|uniref:Uncharacterized protein n=1 Tax=Apiospora rasikravindrae TaxID=990691 RepID=A0ABR1SME5_9PEZI